MPDKWAQLAAQQAPPEARTSTPTNDAWGDSSAPKPGNVFTSGHPFDTLKANVNEAQQGEQPGEEWDTHSGRKFLMGRLKNFGAGGADVIHSLGHAALHPLDTISNYAHEQEAEHEKPITQQLKDTVTSGRILGMGGEGLVNTAKGMLHAPMRTMGQLGTGAIIGEGITGAPEPVKSAVAAPFKAARSAAIGDTDAAALRGLQIGPKSDAQLSTLRSVEKARPYVAGANSQADMQARLKPAMNEVWSPYEQSVEAIGDRPVHGPDGPTTVRELETERQRLSALNRGVKSGNPSDIQQAMQEGRTPAQLIEREEQVKAALDPHLESTGIKPGAVRDTYGSLADIRNGVEGKTTLNEKAKPSGFGRMLNLDPTKPKTIIGEPAQGIRDIAAGRPLWSAKPTDLGIKEGFSTGGPKPDLGTLRPPNISAPIPGRLNAPPIELGASPEVGGVPEGYRPPNFYHDTTPMRTGRLLNAPPIELPGSIHPEVQSIFRHDTTPMRFGRILPPPIKDGELPSSYHTDAFPEQLPSATRVRPKVIEGKK